MNKSWQPLSNEEQNIVRNMQVGQVETVQGNLIVRASRSECEKCCFYSPIRSCLKLIQSAHCFNGFWRFTDDAIGE